MKKLTAIILAVMLCLTLLAGCSNRESAKTAATNAMTAVQKLDDTAYQKYFGTTSSFSDALGEDEAAAEMLNALLGGMTFKVGSVTESGDTATAAITFTNKDINVVMSSYANNLISDIMDGKVAEEDMTDALAQQYFIEALKACEATVSNDVTMDMTYTADGGWQMSGDSAQAAEFFDAITGGFISAMGSSN